MPSCNGKRYIAMKHEGSGPFAENGNAEQDSEEEEEPERKTRAFTEKGSSCSNSSIHAKKKHK